MMASSHTDLFLYKPKPTSVSRQQHQDSGGETAARKTLNKGILARLSGHVPGWTAASI